MKFLLDTNAYTALMRNQPEVVEQVREAELVLMSTIVIGELIFGFRNGSRFQQNFIEDGEEIIRIISARKAMQAEEREYCAR